MLYGSSKDGGFNMIKIKDFFLALKVSWVQRYVNGLKDHWTDLVDMKLDLNKEERIMITNLGSGHPKLNKLINLELLDISLFFKL